MKKHHTVIYGMPVDVFYTDNPVHLISVEWRGVELQDAMTSIEKTSIEAEIEFLADVDPVAVARQAWIEERSEACFN